MKNIILAFELILLFGSNGCREGSTSNRESKTIPVCIAYVTKDEATCIKPDEMAQVRIYYDIAPELLVIASYSNIEKGTFISVDNNEIKPDEVYITDNEGRCIIRPKYPERGFSILLQSQYYSPTFTVYDSSVENIEMVFYPK